MERENMNAEKYMEPKRMFSLYKGSHFHMARDGVLDTYNSYHVSPETEKAWIAELKQEYITNLKVGNAEEIVTLFAEYADLVSMTTDTDGFAFLVEYMNENSPRLGIYENTRNVLMVMNLSRRFETQGLKRLALEESLALLDKIIEGEMDTLTVSDVSKTQFVDFSRSELIANAKKIKQMVLTEMRSA